MAAALASSLCMNSLYSSLLASYSTVLSVQQYCASKYPVSAVTSTVVAPPVTAVSTSVETVSAPTSTSTITDVITSTDAAVTVTTFAPTLTISTTGTTSVESISTITQYSCPNTGSKLKRSSKSVCPNGLDSTYKVNGGPSYGICKHVDSVGSDLQVLSRIATVKACADACSGRKDCVGAVYKQAIQKCWLKSQIGKVIRCEDSTIIYRMQGPTSASSTTTSRKSSTSTTKSTLISTTTSSTSRTSTSLSFQPDATFCSCIASTPTSTISSTSTETSTFTLSSTAGPAVVLTATASSTTHTTPTTTQTITPSTTYTASISTTTISGTTTTVQTTSVYPTSGSVYGHDTCSCSYTVSCGLSVDPSVTEDFFLGTTDMDTCQLYCDSVSSCNTAVYRARPSDGSMICYTYTQPASSLQLVQDSTATLLAKGSGSCQSLGAQCCKQTYNALIQAYQTCEV